VVSSSTAAQISPNLSAVLPQAGIGAIRQGMQEAGVPKQNTPAVPKLHAGSFQSFGEALDSALWHPSESRSEVIMPRALSSGLSGANIASELQAQFSFSTRTGPEQSEPPSSLLGMSTETLRDGMPATGQDRNAEMDRYAVGDEGVPSDLHKTPAAKPSLQLEPALPRAAHESLPPIAMGRSIGTFVSAPSGEAQKSESVEANTLAGNNEPGSVRLTNAIPAQSSAQVGNANPQPSAARSYSDTEAFRIGLQADATLNQNVDFSSAPGSGVKLGSEPLWPAQSFASSGQKAIENSPDTMTAGNALLEKASGQNQTPAAAADGTTKSAATARGTPQPVTQLTPNRSDEDKSGDKGPTQSTDILNAPIAPPATLFHAPGRIVNEGGDLPVNTRPGEQPKLAETSAAGPAKEMIMRLQGGAGEVISVRLVDQGGQVQVAVRSSDPFTAAQLRQDLSSLTNNLDRIGWKADTTSAPTQQTTAPHDTARQDNESQSGHKGSAAEWDGGPPKKKYSTSELWDKVLAGQNA
jgi:hypothetical protein